MLQCFRFTPRKKEDKSSPSIVSEIDEMIDLIDEALGENEKRRKLQEQLA